MAPSKKSEASQLMIVNDVPGEECRIAILEGGHLEELYTERNATATSVGNIYKGRVTNVEPAIQAAFVDYGRGQSGFLHISDLHPRYFPGKERSERVGKKIPRRERPLIQEALRRGDTVLVQVLKEGIGTKGPTLTSYLSIPGRLMVMMPDMDRVGVSRKVEDEQQRREMRDILDKLDLPDGFGFILRTAGFGKTKTDLKRDVAYLTRLWKVMERRIKSAGTPCELYTESDLLIRTIRDISRPQIKAIIADSDSAYERAMGFLQVVAPRSAPKVIRYRRPSPIFHAFDIERQIDLIHAREVPLHSGGKLVIDQTEALVAIDVNSGRSRAARDSETNAYHTNCEAVDEICRQLRLRDLGGLIIHDLIDMRSPKHRRDIEDRFREHLKRDRAKTTILRISEFGILEMTRQRMRPSLRKSHFIPCPHCNGRGEVKAPESVAADAVRQIGHLLQYGRVRRVEIACSPRVASVLLSGKRREMVRLEDATRKRIDVRVSDAIAADRVDFYAYDERNADVDILQLPALQAPTVAELEALERTFADQPAGTPPDSERSRGRRRRGMPGPADATAIALAGGFDDVENAPDEETDDEAAADIDAAAPEGGASEGPHDGESAERRRRRRGRRGGRARRERRERAAALQAALGGDSTVDQPHISGNGSPQDGAALAEHAAPMDDRAGPFSPDDEDVAGEGLTDTQYVPSGDTADAADEPGADDARRGGRERRRSRRGRRGRGDRTDGRFGPAAADEALATGALAMPPDAASAVAMAAEGGEETEAGVAVPRSPEGAAESAASGEGRRSRRRGRRGGRGRKRGDSIGGLPPSADTTINVMRPAIAAFIGGDRGEAPASSPSSTPAPPDAASGPAAAPLAKRRTLYRNRSRISDAARKEAQKAGD